MDQAVQQCDGIDIGRVDRVANIGRYRFRLAQCIGYSITGFLSVSMTLDSRLGEITASYFLSRHDNFTDCYIVGIEG